MLFPLLSKTRFRRPNRSITHEYAILLHLYRLHLWMNLLRSIPRKRDSHERDSFSISSLPSTRREIRSESLSRNERHPRTLKNGWKKKPGCTFGEHKNLSSVYLDRSRSRGDQPPWFRRSPSVALQLFHATKKRKEEGKTERLLEISHPSLASIGFRFPFQLLSPSILREQREGARNNRWVNGWSERDQRRSNNKQE